ncbi:hypothetical protein CCZ01_08150 [Helicobacter monodelphidis]|uniref:pilus assembly FimT family protein n=1 Tax=Helicobacter sp. 15-1451 TaxID=2004995 RepID=UPI000DCAEF99|nr:hypothetical protein [Helicobacter sp. 15-1451]RAX56821.1 hypothetical protein CCZ01_08150 [Helicobacter sp. 15-1451]
MKCFSLLEMICLLICIGLIGFVALVRWESIDLKKAKDQIISDLLLTRNLAMRDDRSGIRNYNKPFNIAEEMRLKKILEQSWRLQFHTISNQNEGFIGATYSIFAKRPRRSGDIDNRPMGFVDIAKNPITGECKSWYNYIDMPKNCRDIRDDRLRIGKNYGVDEVEIKWQTKGCTSVNKTIYFNSLGVPHCGSATAIREINQDATIYIYAKNRQYFEVIRLSEIYPFY